MYSVNCGVLIHVCVSGYEILRGTGRKRKRRRKRRIRRRRIRRRRRRIRRRRKREKVVYHGVGRLVLVIR